MEALLRLLERGPQATGYFYSEISFPMMDVGRAAGSVTLYYMLDSPEEKGGGPGGNGGPQTPLPLRAFTPAVLVSPEPF